jgi:hypothetical protein
MSPTPRRRGELFAYPDNLVSCTESPLRGVQFSPSDRPRHLTLPFVFAVQ